MKKCIIILHNLKIKYKVILCMLVITTFALLMVSFLSYYYFSNLFVNQAKSNANYTLKIASKSFNTQFNSLFSASSRFLGNKVLTKTLRDIEQNNDLEYINNYTSLDSNFTNLIQNNEWISSAFLIDKKGRFYSRSEIGLNFDSNNYFGLDLSKINGITFLPSIESPISKGIYVLPIILPISYDQRMDASLVSDHMENATAALIILLDLNKINQYLNHINNNKGSILYLADNSGYPLSLQKETDSYELALKSSLLTELQHTKDSAVFEETIHSNSYLVTCNNVDIKELKVVSIVLKKDLLSGLTSIRIFILVSWFICSFIAVLLSILLSKFITKPVHSLVNVIKRIQDGNYAERVLPVYQDEMGMLNNSINDMYDTIQQQIIIIKEDAEAKALAEINLLSNQIRPHFLYNTLECIHFEILSNHTAEAASMVESLGQFLRIGLNYGNHLISIQSELTHAEQYIKLMNHMSNQNIDFRSYITPELKDYSITKLILQPLIENCIKHGFHQDERLLQIFNPFIEVRIELVESRVKIMVTDNGNGIDIEKAKASLYHIPEKDSSHIGLNNIYRRLRTYYGEEVFISFFSIPMCQNSVIIEMPYYISSETITE